MGGGGGAKYKNIFAQGKINTELDNDRDDEKKFLQLENPPPPHNFSNGPYLTITT